MKTKYETITVEELTKNVMSIHDDGHTTSWDNEDERNALENYGVVAWNGKLTVRPSYQREFVWDIEKQKKFIYSILHKMTINPLVFADCENDTFECVDGQQRTITLCRFIHNLFAIDYDGDKAHFEDMAISDKKQFMNYNLLIMQNTYESFEEKIEHFRAINQPITILSEQEMRNSACSGTFVNALKQKFGKNKCEVAMHESGYMCFIPDKIKIDRQELTELALFWNLVLIDDEVYNMVYTATNHDLSVDKVGYKIEAYMKKHTNDINCNEVWTNFVDVCMWANDTFMTFKNKQMKNVKNWAYLYRTFKNIDYNTSKLYNECSDLMNDSEIHHKYNIPEYLLIKYRDNLTDEQMMRNEKYRGMLSFTSFPDDIKMMRYREQGERCADCGRKFANVVDGKKIKLDAHHIVPWSNGGRTDFANCAILCKECHGRRHNMNFGPNPYKELSEDVVE